MLYILFLFFLTSTHNIFCADRHHRFDFDCSSSESEDEEEIDAADDGRARGGGGSSSSASSSSSRYPGTTTDLPSAGSKRTRSVSPAEPSPKNPRTKHASHTHQPILESNAQDEEAELVDFLFADAEIPEFPTDSDAAGAQHASEGQLTREDVLTLIRRVIWQDNHKEIILSKEDKRTVINMNNNLAHRYSKRASTEEIAAGEIAIKKLYEQYKIPLEKPKSVSKDPTLLRQSLLILLGKGFILNEEELRQARSLLNDCKHGRLTLTPEEKTKLNKIIKTSQPHVKKANRWKKRT